MRTGGDGRKLDVCYNMQVVVDSKHHLIVNCEVINCANDSGSRSPMSQQAKDLLAVDNFTNLADSGYYNGEAIAVCEENGVTCLVAKPRPGGAKKTKEFSHRNFIYDRSENRYVCPCHVPLSYQRDYTTLAGKEYRGYTHYPA